MNKNYIKTLIVLFTASLISSCGGSGTITEPAAVAGIEIGAALGAASNPYSIQLSGAQVLPAVDTRHTGQAEFSVNEQTGQLFGTVTTSIENANGVHLHEGSSGEVGGTLVSLIAGDTTAGNKTYNVPAGFILTAAQRSMYDSGELYVDIHAVDIELRGQLSDTPPLQTITATLDDLQTKLFTPKCSGCHTGGGNNLPGVMNLSNADATYTSLVGVYSIGEPDFLRVDVSSAENSLLIKKVEGTQTVGARMPFRGAKLDADTIAALIQWINTGANR